MPNKDGKDFQKSAAIIPSGQLGTNMMRGRDVREKLRGHMPPEAVEVIARVAEINHTNSLAIAELATMQNKFVDIIQGFTDIAENMKQRTDQMARAMGDVASEQIEEEGKPN